MAAAAAPAGGNGARLKTAVAAPHEDARTDAAFDHGIRPGPSDLRPERARSRPVTVIPGSSL